MKLFIASVFLGLLVNCCHGRVLAHRQPIDLGRVETFDRDDLEGVRPGERDSAFDTAVAIDQSFLGNFRPSPFGGHGTFGTAGGSAPAPKVDLLYVIDKSGSIGATDFQKSIDLVVKLIDVFPVPISSDGTRIAAISYSSSDRVDLDFNFDACDSSTSCKNLVKGIDFESGSTFTGRGLQLARTSAFTGARIDATKVLFLITDGQSNGDLNVVDEANALKNQGVEIYALGVTDNINRHELKQIVSKPVTDHLFYFDSFSAMGRGVTYLDSIFRVSTGGNPWGNVGGGFFDTGNLFRGVLS